MQNSFSLLVFVTGAWISWQSYRKAKHGHFFSDTPSLWPFGVFVWGDGLVLGPFWMVSAGLLTIMPALTALRYLLVFFTVRPAYEVIYWLNHQAVGKTYQPPLVRNIKWLGSEEAAIVYQLANMCQAVIGIGLLFLSYSF